MNDVECELPQKLTQQLLNQDYVLVEQFKSAIVAPSVLEPAESNIVFNALNTRIKNDSSKIEINNLEQLKAVLTSLAQYQAVNLTTLPQPCEYNIDNLWTFKESPLKDSIQDDLNRLIKTHFLVKTIWSPAPIYLKNGSAIILDVTHGPLMPPTYDALLYIFSLSDEKFRQSHFSALTKFYFATLTGALPPEYAVKFTDAYMDMQLNTLLPISKLTLVKLKQDEIVENFVNYLRHPQLHPENVYDIVRNKLGSNEYVLLEYSLKGLNDKNGHLGEYFHLKCSVNFNGNIEEFVLFAKIIGAHTEVMKSIIENGVGKKENFFYDTLMTLYKESAMEDLFGFAPNCYFTNSVVTVLDDLSQHGFQSVKPNFALNLDGTKIILNRLATFHASSIVVEEALSKKLGKEFRFADEYPGYFDETIIIYEGEFKKWFDNALKGFIYLVDKLPHLKNKVPPTEDQLRAKGEQLMHSPMSLVKRSKVRRNVINHGDMYVGNMMFKFKDDAIVDGVLVDFQLLRYVPPAYEVLFFIILSTDSEVKLKHFDELLDFYYSSFANFLKKYNLNPDSIYAKQDFLEDVEEMKPAAAMVAFNYGHILLVPADFREDVLFDQEKMEYYLEKHKDVYIDIGWKDDNYRRRVSNIVEFMVDVM